MRNLILVRHGKSSWKEASVADIDRPLNKRGKRDAPFMGKRLREMRIKPDLIISSPAKRARKTAEMIAGELDFAAREIAIRDAVYRAGAGGLIDLVNAVGDHQACVILVGHNPDLTDLANRLADQPIEDIPTCGIISLKFPVTSWKKVVEGSGKVAFIDFPKKHSLPPVCSSPQQ